MAIQHTNQASILSLASVSRGKSILKHMMDSLGDFLLNYWAHIITIALGTLVLAAISVPFLSFLGLDVIAKPIFFALHYVCAQIPSHSFYVFGHQLGLCARNFSIYAAMFLGSWLFVLTKKRLPGIPWWVWVLMILPMALDGTTQMFGLRESIWYLRIITGTLFGFGTIWFALPMMQKALLDTPAQPPVSARSHTITHQHVMPMPETTMNQRPVNAMLDDTQQA